VPIREQLVVSFLVFKEILCDYTFLQPPEFFTGIIISTSCFRAKIFILLNKNI